MRRPLTVIVLIIAVLLGAVVALRQMPRDILPSMGVPTLYVAQPYGGMDPAQMEGYLTYYYEYHFLYITGIEHVESKSIQGNAIIKLQFHPGTDMAQAMAETVGYVNRARAFMPPGTVPPFVMRFDAGSVAVGNLVFMSDTLSVGELADVGLNRVRPMFATLPGVSAPPPFGGSARAVVIRANPDRLRAYNFTPDDVVNAIASANALTPSGNVRIGDQMPMVPMNATVKNIKDLESVPIKPGSYPAVFVRDIGTVEDSTDITTAYALVNGRRAVYIPVTKRADASTLSVVNLVKASLPRFQAAVPPEVKISFEFDQSPFIVRAIKGLTMEGVLGALLTGLMVLLFLRDWRSVFIVLLTIPISLLAATFGLWLTHQTVNLMTLGGLALAIGILVDEATVTVENIHTHLARGKTIARAALDATAETALPRLLAMLCVLSVFIPAFFLVGPGKALFIPLALAVAFSMVASYLLSSSFVPVMSTWLLREHEKEAAHTPSAFSSLQKAYGDFARKVMSARVLLTGVYLLVALGVIAVFGKRLGAEIFPTVDTGQFQLRLRAPTGTRIEKTEALTKKTLDVLKDIVGKDNVDVSIAFVGTQPASFPVNLIHVWTGGPEEAVMQIALKRGNRPPIEKLKETLREKLRQLMPDVRFSFEPSDVVSRVMSFGSPTPIEVAVSGTDLEANRVFAEKIRGELAKIPSLRDLQFQQAFDYPTVEINVNRERAGMMGVTVADTARSVVAATSSSRFTTPVYWADPKTGVAYQIQVEVPEERMDSLEAVKNIPVVRKGQASILLRNVAEVKRGTAVGEYNRYNMQRTATLTANLSGEDLGHVAAQIRSAIKAAGEAPASVKVFVRGQVAPMEDMLDGLRTGLLFAIVVIFLMLSANFQSLRLSLVVISTVPAVIAGVAVALWVTGTTLNVQSFMGAIMSIGVAVANAILLVTFAERNRVAGMSAVEAALDAARSRLRPILMTSCAMIAGMIPMALGLGDGGEQTAPLGRAVIGGLAAATVATLVVLPSIFALIRGRSATASRSLDPDDTESGHYLAASPTK